MSSCMKALRATNNIIVSIQYQVMLVEDHRNISCGGDPFNYLKSALKGIYFQLDPGQDAQILLLKEKFPYDEEIFEGLARTSKLKLVNVDEKDGEVSVIVRRINQQS